jgi:3-oxoadipate enol-lactonase
MDLTSWDCVAPLLAREFTVLRYDRRGFGQSAVAASLRGDRDDALALLDELQIGQAVILGMSQGARVALDIAVFAPHRARALILDGAPLIDAEAELPLDEYLQIRNQHGLEAMRSAIAAHPLMKLAMSTALGEDILRTGLHRYSGADLDAVQTPTSARATAVQVPSLVLIGEKDSAARRKAAQLLHARIAGSRLCRLGGAGHLAALDDPASYAAAVSAFCRSLH